MSILKCVNCSGTGLSDNGKEPCSLCNGRGKYRDPREFESVMKILERMTGLSDVDLETLRVMHNNKFGKRTIIKAIAAHIREGRSFRQLIYDRLKFSTALYPLFYHRGVMDLNNRWFPE